ncbi:metal-dependent hydrolase [Desulfovibrio sp. OttesenSCG-928-F20]|nr:metal-dependent hydrolase [Desulfovibrio sp. OttesenSCG-928-M16]MDL2291044.1 metal-dependent hydrolase [Desulfovibrio sp. OttesenSCG-928-F20]
MDSLTHLVAGALTPLAFRNTPKRAALVAFGIAAGELPDIDIVFGASPEALMTLHRGITHALFWQPIMALLVVIPFYLWLANRPKPTGFDNQGNSLFLRMWLIALLALVLHVYLDCMTTFGTQALLPFSSMRVSLPAMFIVDPLLTLPALILLVLALRQPPSMFAFYSDKARLFAKAGLVWLLLYPLLALGCNMTMQVAFGPRLMAEANAKNASSRLILMTEPFSPFVWKAIVDGGQAFAMTTLSLPGLNEERLYCTHAKPDPQLYAALKRQARIFAYFEDFAPLMTQSERSDSFFTQYTFADLRYIAAPDSFTHQVGRGEPMFVLQARVNESGVLLAYRFLHRADEHDTPWETGDAKPHDQ